MARIKIGNIKGPVGPTGQTGKTGPIGPIGPAGPLPPLADNFTTTQAGVAALDAAAGKRLHEGVNQLNSEMIKAKTGIINPNSNTFDIAIAGITKDWCSIVQLMDAPDNLSIKRIDIPVVGVVRVTTSAPVNHDMRYIIHFVERK